MPKKQLGSAYLGEDVPIAATYTDPSTGDPLDPDDTTTDGNADATVTITNPSGTAVVDDAAMTRNGVGDFEYVWDTATETLTGSYTVAVEADIDGETKIQKAVIPIED